MGSRLDTLEAILRVVIETAGGTILEKGSGC